MSETLLVDYSFARPDPASIAAAGYRGIARYASPPPNGKNVTAEEIGAAHAAGLFFVGLWETYEQAASRTGYAGGQNEGAQAIAFFQSVGLPAGCAIYFVLEDPSRIPASSYPAAIAYAQGVRDLGGPYRIGGYGSDDLLHAAMDAAVIELGMQVEGWSAGVSPRCHIYQRSNGRELHIAGVDDSATDEDVALQTDIGAWQPNITTGGDDMSAADVEAINEYTSARANDITGTILPHVDPILPAILALGQKVGAELDTQAIIKGVLAGLSPQTIADLIDEKLAQGVVDALGQRITAGATHA